MGIANVKPKLAANRLVFDIRRDNALMAADELSDDPGGPNNFQVDEEFDRRFHSTMETGDPGRRGGTDDLLRAFSGLALRHRRRDLGHGGVRSTR